MHNIILHQCCFEIWIMNTVANEIYYTVLWETIDNCKQLDIGLHTASNFYCNAHDIVSHCWNSKWQKCTQTTPILFNMQVFFQLMDVYTVKPPNKGHFLGTGLLSFLWRSSLSWRFTVFWYIVRSKILKMGR